MNQPAKTPVRRPASGQAHASAHHRPGVKVVKIKKVDLDKWKAYCCIGLVILAIVATAVPRVPFSKALVYGFGSVCIPLAVTLCLRFATNKNPLKAYKTGFFLSLVFLAAQLYHVVL